jgi:cytochrome c-type biogenesis protein CcmH/NrfG
LRPLAAAAQFGPVAVPSRAEMPASVSVAQRRLAPPAQAVADRPVVSSTPLQQPAAAVDSTQDVSLEDVSFGEVRGACSADNTQDVSLSEICLAQMDVAHGTAEQAAMAAPRAAHGQDDERKRSADSARRKRWLWSAVFAVGALLVGLRVGWFAFSEARVPDGTSKPKPAVQVADAPPRSAERESSHGSAAPVSVPAPQGPSPALAGSQLPSEARSGAQALAAPAARAPEGPADQQDQAGSEHVASAASPGGSSAAAQPSDPELDGVREIAASRARGLVDQALALQKRRKYAPAKARYREALNVYPDFPGALAGLTQLAIRQRDGKQAVLLAKQLVRAQPEEVSHLVLLGDAYKSAGKRREARQAWRAAAHKDSAAARARLKR